MAEDGKIYTCTKCGHRSHMINEPHNCVNMTIREEPKMEGLQEEALYNAMAVIYEMAAKMLFLGMTIPNSYFNFMEDYADEIAKVETRN